MGHHDLQPFQDSIHFHPRIVVPDHYAWKGHLSGRFTIDSAQKVFRDSKPIKSMHHLLRFSNHISRYFFIPWLTFFGWLHTMYRRHAYQIITSSACILCGLDVETYDYLFFQCLFSAAVWGVTMSRTLMDQLGMACRPLIQWAYTHFQKKKDFTLLLARLVLLATIYFIWYERNNRVFHHTYQPHHDVSKEIYKLIQSRLIELAP